MQSELKTSTTGVVSDDTYAGELHRGVPAASLWSWNHCRTCLQLQVDES
jgi:hypothetical protein